MSANADEWSRLWSGISELSEQFDNHLVFIGGVAVYLHVHAEGLPENFIEYSHDGDFYISRADYSDLNDTEEVTINRRLNKHQIIKNGIEFDVFLEDRNNLRVRYEDAAAASEIVEGVRVASLEHLLLLKLDAYSDRKGSGKGRKDERDLIRIGYLLQQHGVDQSLLQDYLTDDMVTLFKSIEKSPEFVALCLGNLHQAKKLRLVFADAVADVAKTLE